MKWVNVARCDLTFNNVILKNCSILKKIFFYHMIICQDNAAFTIYYKICDFSALFFLYVKKTQKWQLNDDY